LTLEYAEYEILVVNDGSKDQTMQVMIDAYDFIPATRMPTAHIPTARTRAIYRSRHHANLWLVDKENGGKADALNAGINLCRTPYFCGMDADTLLERDSLARAIRPFLEDGRTVAAGGIIRIVNGCSVKHGIVTEVKLPPSNVASMQVLEYLRAFLSARMGWSALDAMLIISGAFGVFRRSAVVEVGGYYTDTVGEDMELIVRLHRYHLENKIPYRIAFVPDPVAWTECPESLTVLGRQRDRWQRGLYQSLLRHKVMMLNPRYGRVGMLAFPYFFFLEMLGPVVEVAGYLTFGIAFALGRYDLHHAGAFIAVAILFGIANSIAAVGLEELTFRRYSRLRDLLRLMWLGIAENFGYRQLGMYWRLRGLLSARKAGKGWGAMVRKGFNTPTTTAVLAAGFSTMTKLL
jgi:cellulose synthase/poly-beta-1,6-N-acetylglucosamine synthase-like glycosyltransferase